MADFIKGLFGSATSSVSAASTADADFADFADAPSPLPASLSQTVSGLPARQTFGPGVPFHERPYTKWYRVHERVSPSDFIVEAFVLPLIVVLLAFYVWGTTTNRRKARRWIQTNAPLLSTEYAVVGFGGVKSRSDTDSLGADALVGSGDLLKEKSKDMFLSYATGRQNVAFVDIKLDLLKRQSPIMWASEVVLGFFFDSMPASTETVQITAYAFDGKESDVVPRQAGQQPEKKGPSAYDGFVWAVVHKDKMKNLRNDRYDLSLTATKDHPKLPGWATVMSESAEITDTLLTADLVKAINECGEDLESLIVSDMPEDAPKTLDDLIPKKRLQLNVRLVDRSQPQPLLAAFLRFPDHLVNSAHFRTEVLRRVKTTRDEEAKKIRKLDELEKAEGRKNTSDKAKKDEREKRLKGMSAEEQRKFLEKERERDQKKSMARRSMKA